MLNVMSTNLQNNSEDHNDSASVSRTSIAYYYCFQKNIFIALLIKTCFEAFPQCTFAFMLSIICSRRKASEEQTKAPEIQVRFSRVNCCDLSD